MPLFSRATCNIVPMTYRLRHVDIVRFPTDSSIIHTQQQTHGRSQSKGPAGGPRRGERIKGDWMSGLSYNTRRSLCCQPVMFPLAPSTTPSEVEQDLGNKKPRAAKN